MAGKLSEIRASSPAAAITGSELVEVTQSGATKAATVAEILGALPSHSHPEAQRISVNNQTGTTYTAVATDAGKVVRCNNAAAVALTLPTGGVFTVGDVVMVRQVGAGQVTASGGTLNIPAGVSAKTRVQGSVMSLHYVAAGTWDVSGDLA